MSERFSSYFSLGFFIFTGLMVVMALKDRLLFRLAWRNILKDKLLSLFIIFASIIPPVLIVSSLIVNDSVVGSSQDLINQKLGNTSSIIYSADVSKTWDLKKSNEIFTKVSDQFSNFLPIRYELQTISSGTNVLENTIILNYDENISKSYLANSSLSTAVSPNINLSQNEVILSSSIANSLNVQEGGTVNVTQSGTNRTLIIKKILPDNGLIGFNLPLPSNYETFNGSVYVQAEFFNTKEDLYNALLLRRSGTYDAGVLERTIKDRLLNYDRTLVFEELRSYLRVRSEGGSSSLNFGQVLLVINIIAILSSIILIFSVSTLKYLYNYNSFNTVQITGVKRSSMIRTLAFEGFIYALAASLVGAIIGIGFSRLIFDIVSKIVSTSVPELEYQPVFNFYLDSQTLIYAFAGSFFVLFFSLIFFSYRVVSLNIRNRTLLKLTTNQSVLLILSSIFSLTLLYYSLTNKFGSGAPKAFSSYVAITVIILTAMYGLQFIWNKRKVVSICSLILLALNILCIYIQPFKQTWQDYPYLILVNCIFILFSSSILLIYNTRFVSRAFNLLPFVSNKNLKLGFSYISEYKVQSSAIFFVLTVLVFFVAVVSIARFQVNKIVNTVSTEYQVIINDKLGRSNARDLIKNIDGVNSVLEVNYTAVTLNQFQYQNLKNFDETKLSGIKKEENYATTLVTVGEGLFENAAFISDFSLEELQSKFLNSNQYVILGKNFSTESTSTNLHPDLKLGDKVEIEIEGQKISREVIAIVNTEGINTFGNTISTSGSQGILVSQKDLDQLRNTQSIYIPAVFGVRVDKSIEYSKLNQNLSEVFKGSRVAKITVTDEVVDKNIKFLNDLVYLSLGFVILGLLISFFALTAVLNTWFVLRKDQNRFLQKAGFSASYFVKIYNIQSLMLVFFSCILGLGISIFGVQFLYRFLIDEGKLFIPWAELLIICLGLILSSQLISYLAFKFSYPKNTHE